MIQDQLRQLDRTKTYQQFLAEQQAENDAAMARILSTKIGKEAYARQFNIPLENLEGEDNGYSMLGAIENFYSENDYEEPNNKNYNNYFPWQ